MRPRTLFPCFVSLLVAAGSVAAQTESPPPPTPSAAAQSPPGSAALDAIEQARKRFVRAWQSTGGHQIVKNFTRGAQISAPNGSIFLGRRGHQVFAQYAMAVEATNANFEAESVSPTADGLVSETGWYVWVSRGKTFRGRYAIEWQHVEGTWLIQNLSMSL
jgi:hypothetical protein